MEISFSEIQTVFSIEERDNITLLRQHKDAIEFAKIGRVDLPGTYAVVQVSPDDQLVQDWMAVEEGKYRSVE